MKKANPLNQIITLFFALLLLNPMASFADENKKAKKAKANKAYVMEVVQEIELTIENWMLDLNYLEQPEVSALEADLEIENWMQRPLNSESFNPESELLIESWMQQPLEQVVPIQMDDELPVEMWMQDENYLPKNTRMAEADPELELEAWMHETL